MSSTPAWPQRLRRMVTGDGLRAQLLRGGAGSLLLKGLQAVIALALTIVLARVLGPEHYGIYSFVLAVILLIAIPTQVGTPQLVVRETAKAHASENWPRIRGLWRWANRLVMAFSLTALLLFLAALWVLGDTIGSATIHTALAGAALIPLVALANLRAAALRGLRQVVIGQLPEKIVRPATLLLLFLLAAYLPVFGDMTAEWTMALHAVAATVAFLSGWLLLNANPAARIVRQHDPTSAPRSWRRAILPLSIIAGFQLLNNHVDIVVLGVFREADEVGVFRAVSQLSITLLFAFNAIQYVLQPYFARYSASRQRETLQRVVTGSANVLLGIGLLVSVPLLLIPDHLLTLLFGEDYRGGSVALQILIVGLFLKAVLGMGATLLTMAGHETQTMKITGVAALANLLLNVLLIPWLGMIGAALATTVTFSGWALWLRFVCKSKLDIETSPLYRNR